MLLHAPLAVLLLSAAAVAQSVGLALATPAQLSAVYNGAVQVTPLVPGPLASAGTFTASATALGSSSVQVDWQASGGPSALQFDLAANFVSVGSLVGQATATPCEFLVAVNAPLSIVHLELQRELAGVASAVFPVTRIDVHDDGWFEMTEAAVNSIEYVTAVVGAGPLMIRCTVGGQLSGAGSIDARLTVRVLPAHTGTVPLGGGCGEGYQVAPRFDGGLDCMLISPPGQIGVAVFGLSTAPVVLGVQGMPCLLWPQPDLLVLVAAWQPFTLPIPAAARPVRLFTQAVTWFGPGSLVTSPGWWVEAM